MATDSTEVDEGALLRRARSAGLLVAMLLVLGVLTATVLGMLVVALATLLNRALG